jgi:hypothetical protein
LLPQLEADDPADREAASGRLELLGNAGVLAAMRMDMSNLSAEQKARLLTFVSRHRHQPAATAAAQRRDPAFLIDCLESFDPAVRMVARAELEKVVGKSIKFDPTLPEEAVAAAADVVRKEILAPTAVPQTQPAVP